MSNNLSELNTILFDTLRGLKDGSVTKEQAQAVTNVGNAIINNSKVQLDAFKLTRGKGNNAEQFGLKREALTEGLAEKDRYEQMLEYSASLGYTSTADAMAAIGKVKFEKDFQTWLRQILKDGED